MALYRAVEGELGAVNVLTALTTFGAVAAAGPIKVPDNASKITEIWVTVGPHVDTAGDNVAVTLRLSGNGVGPNQDFVVWGAGGGVTNTGTASSPAAVYKVDINVFKNENITVEAAAVGDDVLIATVGVTLKFE